MFQKNQICKVVDCVNFARANGMCQTHNMRAWRGRDLHSAGTRSGAGTKFIRENIDCVDDDCLIWPFYRTPTGYGDVNFPHIEGQAHRVMCILAHGKPPSAKHEAAHSCGKGHCGCINPRHLSWKIRIDNIRDKAGHGTQLWGEQVHFAKLTIEQAVYIKYCGLPGVVMAQQFNIKPTTVYNIRCGRTWKGI